MWLTANTNLYISSFLGVKCQAHNLKVVGSNPTPATNLFNKINSLYALKVFRFWSLFVFKSHIFKTTEILGRQDNSHYIKKKL